MNRITEWMKVARRILMMSVWGLATSSVALAAENALQEEVAALYDQSLEPLFKHFHAIRNCPSLKLRPPQEWPRS